MDWVGFGTISPCALTLLQQRQISDNNCFYAELDANQPVGETVKINVPAQFPIQVFGQVYIADQQEAGYCQLDVVVHDNNRYQVKGCIARQAKPFGLSFAVQDPDAYAAAIIQRQLKRLGIEFTGKVKQPQNHSKGKNSPSIYLNHCLS